MLTKISALAIRLLLTYFAPVHRCLWRVFGSVYIEKLSVSLLEQKRRFCVDAMVGLTPNVFWNGRDAKKNRY